VAEPAQAAVALTDAVVATDAWKSTFPGAVVGALALSRVRNPELSPALEVRKRELEQGLRADAARTGGEGIGHEPVLRAYADYYRARGKTYQVKAQWESVALSGKAIPSRAALVEAMFMAELESLVLTAGHDLSAVELPVRVDVTGEDDRYVLMSGTERVLGEGDMMMVDGRDVIASVVYGPDRRTRITPQTSEVLFVAYAPAGIGEEAARRHLEVVRSNVLLVSPEAQTELLTAVVAR
jgi:DNA/RNA-binding domain of Phe-tRNA-synthetase-like protein